MQKRSIQSKYYKPGPGVSKDEPRKKGFLRFVEVLRREFGNLIKLNFLVLLCVVPAQIMLWLAIGSLAGPVSLWSVVYWLLFLIFSLPVGAGMAAGSHGISQMLRDDPGFVWHDFKRFFRSSFKQTAVMGIVFTVLNVVYIQMQLLFLVGGFEYSKLLSVIYIISVMMFHLVYPYYFLQAGYLELSSFNLFKNSIFLALGHAPRSLVSAVILLLSNTAMALFFPASLLVLLPIGYALPALLSLMWIWPVVDKAFGIEEKLKE
jgi:uncharacterized membrane protein YesL